MTMEPHYLKRLFSKRRRPSSDEKKPGQEVRNVGSHDLFLEKKRPLPRSEDAPSRPSFSFSRTAARRPSMPFQENVFRPSGESLRSQSDAYDNTRKSFSGLSRATTMAQSLAHTTSKRRRKSRLSLSTSTDEPRDGAFAWARRSLDQRPQQEPSRRPSTSGWLRRLKSTNFKSHDLSLGQSTDTPPYDEALCANGHLPAPILDFGKIPGSGHERPRTRKDFSSGAAARAAAAAQNELLESMRKMRLSEPQVTQDSESGIGIERGDSPLDFEAPVVRQGMSVPSL